MKKFVIVLFVSFTLTGTNGLGAIDLFDGGCHRIDYVENQLIRIDYGYPGKGTTVEVVEGGSSSISACQDSKIIVSGGYARPIGNDNSTVIMTGGAADWLHMTGSSRAVISGGILGGEITIGRSGLQSTSSVTLIGSSFAINGQPLSYGQYFATDFARGTITGVLQNGDIINCTVQLYDQSSLILIPEPATLLFLAFGAVCVRRFG